MALLQLFIQEELSCLFILFYFVFLWSLQTFYLLFIYLHKKTNPNPSSPVPEILKP